MGMRSFSREPKASAWVSLWASQATSPGLPSLQRCMQREVGETYVWRLLSQTRDLFGLQLCPIFELESRSHMFDRIAKIAQPVVRH